MEQFCRGTERRLVVPMSLMMCKKCFSAFERYRTLAKLIINKMKKALSVFKQDVELPAIKKPRLDFDAGRESFTSSISFRSRGVAVSIFCYMLFNNWILICMIYYRFMLDTKIPRLTFSHLNTRNSGRHGKKKPQASCNGMHEK